MTRNLWYGTSGPQDADIVIVGEAWGADEEQMKQPFVGASGRALNDILRDAGLKRSRIFVTNVVAERPPNNDLYHFFGRKDDFPEFRGLFPSPKVVEERERLLSQLRAYPRKLIIGAGAYALWALTDLAGHHTVSGTTIPGAGGVRAPNGISSQRGSMTFTSDLGEPVPFLPIYHPAAILYNWPWRAITVQDLRVRVPLARDNLWNPPPFSPNIRPSLSEIDTFLRDILIRANGGEKVRLVADIETAKRHIICFGLTDRPNWGMVIPFVTGQRGDHLAPWWGLADEKHIVSLLIQILSHPNVEVEGQNFKYDMFHTSFWWGCIPNIKFDTMVAHHLLWPGTPKGLDYLASMYCDHYRYWKADSKEWNEKGDINSLLFYNALDLKYTWEVGDGLRAQLSYYGMWPLFERRMANHDLALEMEERGVSIDTSLRAKMTLALDVQIDRVRRHLERLLPQSLVDPGAKAPWYRSPLQQREFFASVLNIKIPLHRRSGKPTLDKKTMSELPNKYPEYRELFESLAAYRSLGVFRNTFMNARLRENRMHCSFNVTGTETFRWSSSKSPFHDGTNLQNQPAGGTDDIESVDSISHVEEADTD